MDDHDYLMDLEDDDDADYEPSDNEHEHEIDYEDLAMERAERDALSAELDEHDLIETSGQNDGIASGNASESPPEILAPFIFNSNVSPVNLTLSDLLRLISTGSGIELTDSAFSTRMSRRRQRPHPSIPSRFTPVKEPQAAGVELLQGGEFGGILRKRQRQEGKQDSLNLARSVRKMQASWKPIAKEEISSDLVPNTPGVVVASYRDSAYSGQYSKDSSFYYTCCRDFRLHVYDTTAPLSYGYPHEYDEHTTTMKVIKTVKAVPDSWTITDSHLSPDNERMIWASVTPVVYMTSTTGLDTTQTAINFADRSSRSAGVWGGFGYHNHCSIWSCRFSADGNEVVAGGDGRVFVYDLIADKRTVKIEAHDDDVNSCCWADTASGNVLISASDDTFLKVWDRRSLGSHTKPSGVLIGHTEGITYVSPKGDGRYVISNGKDQLLRLWDLRKMRSDNDFQQVKGLNYGVEGFDYRQEYYPTPQHAAHPKDCSVMRYHGHAVLRTLIRCHFSPAETTGQQYIYSGSADGKIHVWSLDGRVVEILDRKHTLPINFDASGPEPRGVRPQPRDAVCVRDVSWHSQEPVIMSAGWDSSRGRGGSTIAKHEWKGLYKSGGQMPHHGVEDYVARRALEEQEKPLQIPGAYERDD